MLRFFGQPRNSAFPGGQTTLNGYITSHVPYPKENICTFILFSFTSTIVFSSGKVVTIHMLQGGQILGENSAIAHY